jgi:hypothetical protein
VSTLMAAQGLTWAGVVRWGHGVPLDEPGIYVVAMTDSLDAVSASADCPISDDAVQKLLDARPELTLDGLRPTREALTARIAAMWLHDETIVYIGLAGTSAARRVRDYYATPLGARKPHAGGWPLKTLSNLDSLWVHFAGCDNVGDVETALLRVFVAGVSDDARRLLHDPTRPIPFANLEITKGERKMHGIRGARESRPRPSAPSRPLY